MDKDNHVDKFIDEYRILLPKRRSINNLLKDMQAREKKYTLSTVKSMLTDEQFTHLREIIEFFKDVSIYHQNDRVNIVYLCKDDPIQIKWWYHHYLKNFFEAEQDAKWNYLKNHILKLESLIQKINELSPPTA